MLNKYIRRLELEQVADGVQVTIFYDRGDISLPPMTATLAIKETLGEKTMKSSISDYFYEIGKILGLEKGCTIDWEPVKEIPDEYLLEHPECQWSPIAAMTAPGRRLWVAEKMR